jgi:dGTPase
VPAALAPDSHVSKKLLQLVPGQFQPDTQQAGTEERLRSVVDFVSGMTDLFAVELYRKIKGIALPELS